MKLLKNIFLIFIVVCIFNIFHVKATFEIEAYLEVDTDEVLAGEEIFVSVGLNNVSSIPSEEDGIAVLVMELHYDSTKFTLPLTNIQETLNLAAISDSAKILSEHSIDLGLHADDIICTVELDNLDVIKIQILYSAYNQSLKEDGEIFKLKFTAIEDTGGNSNFIIDQEGSIVKTSNSGEEYSVNNTNANIQVEVISKDVSIESLYVTSLGDQYFGKYVNGSFEVLVPNGTTEIDLNVIPGYDKATVNGEGLYQLTNSRGQFTVEVTAQDGETKKSYNVLVRPMKNINTLSKVEVIGAEFILEDTKTNTITLAEQVSNYELKITYSKNVSFLFHVRQASGAVIYHNSEKVQLLPYNNFIGTEEINLEVQAEDGSIRVYSFEITMEEATSDTSFANVTSNQDVEVEKLDNVYTLNYKYSNNNKVRIIIKPSSNATTVSFISSPLTFSKVGEEYISDEITLTPGVASIYNIKATALDETVENYSFKLMMDEVDTRSSLNKIYINGEELSGFSKDIYHYDLGYISYNIESLLIDVEKESEKSQVLGIGEVSLKSGANVIIITVKSETPYYGEEQLITTYYLSYYREKLNHNNSLEELKVNGVSLDLSKSEFHLEFPYKDSFAFIEAKLTENSSGAKITGNIGFYNLDIGLNNFVVLVESEDGQNQKQYKINITRIGPSLDTGLERLEIDFIEIEKTDDKYYLEVDYSVNHIHIKAFPNDPNATVVGEGWQVLELGKNTFILRVISSEADRSSEYVVEVFRNSPTSNALLEILDINEVENFEFDSEKFTYSVNVNWEIQAVTIYAKTQNPNSLIIQNKKNEYEFRKDLSIGNNQVVLNVEAEDGTILNYSLIIVRQTKLNKDSSLLSLEIEGYDPFDLSEQETEIKLFNLIVPYSETTIRVKANPTSEKSLVVGATTHTLNVGLNQIDITCFAEDGSYTIYRIYVFRDALSSNNYIERLEISEKEDFVFHKDTLSYVIFFEEKLEKLNLNVMLADEDAEYKIIGNSDFTEGINTVEIKVTAADDSTRTYTLFINIEESKGVDPKVIVISTLGATNIGLIVFLIIRKRKLKL